MNLTLSFALALALTVGDGLSSALGQDVQPLQFASAGSWVCRPELPGCDFDLSTTIIDAHGSRRVETFRPAATPKLDCFYVYPTVSDDPGFAATLPVTANERRAVRQQVARLGSVCRLFVPFYRQATYTSMKSGFVAPGHAAQEAADRLADKDILAAWNFYIARDNGGRPFVLIGHSQGAMRLIRLIQNRIDGKPIQSRMLSAILPGAFVLAPKGKSVGGTFKSIPPCRRKGQTGCFLAFNTIRAETVLPDGMKPDFPAQELVCTNPAALDGGAGELKAYLSTWGETIIPELTAQQPRWTRDGNSVRTPFVRLPGLYSGECRSDPHGAFLVVTERPRSDDLRTGEMSGDWIVNGKPVAEMGLHLIDLNLTAGNLIDVIRGQLQAWRQRDHPRSHP
jgi:hypothetical protein